MTIMIAAELRQALEQCKQPTDGKQQYLVIRLLKTFDYDQAARKMVWINRGFTWLVHYTF